MIVGQYRRIIGSLPESNKYIKFVTENFQMPHIKNDLWIELRKSKIFE